MSSKVRSTWSAPIIAALSILGSGVAGANSAVLSGMLVVTCFLGAASILLMARIDRRVRSATFPVELALVLLLGWAAIPAIRGGGLWTPVVAIAPEAFALEYLKLASTIAVFFASMATGLQRGALRAFGGWIVLFGAVLMVATLAARQYDLLGYLDVMGDTGFHRFSGTIGNPNAAGCFYGMLTIVAAGYTIDCARRAGARAGQAFVIGGAALTMAGAFAFVLLSQSRSGFLLTLSGAVLLVMTQVLSVQEHSGMKWRNWPALIAGALAACVGLPLIANTVFERLSIVDTDGLGRWGSLRHYAAFAWNAPTFGYGLGSFFEFNQRHLDANTALEFWSFGAAHNAALQFALEAGWPGLVLLGLASALVAIKTVPAMIAHADAVGIAMILAICIPIGCSCVDIALNVPGIAVFTAGLAGLCWGRSWRFRSAN